MDLAPPASAAPTAARGVSVSVVADDAINFAFQQNSIPVVRELRIANEGSEEQRACVVRITTEPAFALPLELRIASLAAGAEFRAAPLDLVLSPEFLRGLTERIAGLLHIEVTAGPRALARHTRPLTLLAPNEWSGLVALPEILAAFILPNDPAVMTILDTAADILREHTGRSALNGYQDRSRERAWQQLEAIFQSVARHQIRYVAPPASFEETGQKIRFPTQIIAERFATCLDLVLLFAACCEQAGLHPVVLMHCGHAYAGCWLVERTLAEPATDDQQAIRKLVELEELAVFELTAVTAETPGSLADADVLARRHLEPGVPFRIALDVRRARSTRIHPLPLPGAPISPAPVSAPVAPANPAADFAGRTFAESPAAAPSAEPAAWSRVDLWKSRLLDLSLRNRLLNFRPTKGTVQILSAAPEHVEDELAANLELRLVPRPTVMAPGDPRDAGLYARHQKTDARAEHLREELRAGRLHTALDEAEHQRRLTELYRAARLALEENGTNTLYAAVGVLEWRETEHSDRLLRAPLLLIPVELKRKSVIEGFQLRRIDEEPRLNVTLMEMLRQHFKKEIPGVDPLPEDERGVDVARVLRLFREAVRDLPGWEVKNDIWLGQFSFTKFLLWKDLADGLDDLARNRVVRHLVQEGGAPFPNPPDDIQPAELDDRFPPAEILCPRSADSSQLAAVMAAAAGADFVLEGPPGTGKSQTITNLIAHSLAHGKRVLFVAEKRAALDVVHRRLKEEGLAPFCLELHSNKAGKGEVLAQFRASLDFAAQSAPAEWARTAGELQRLRDTLNDYVRGLHRIYPCGLSAHDCLDFLLPRQTAAGVKLEAGDYLAGDAEYVARCRDACGQLAQRAELLDGISGHPLAAVRQTEWSPVWAERTRALLKDIAALAPATEKAARELLEWLHRSARTATRPQLAALREMAGALLAPHPVGAAFLLTPWDQLARDLDGWIALATERRGLRTALAGYDERRLLALDLDALEQTWRTAQPAWFVVKWIRIGGILRQLQTARPDGRKPSAENLGDVLERARRLREVTRALAAIASAASPCLGTLWANGEPDPDALERARTWGESLHAHMIALTAGDLGTLRALRQHLADLFAEGITAFGAGTTPAARLSAFARAWDEFDEVLDDLTDALALERAPLDGAPEHLTAVNQCAAQIEGGWRQIRAWCSWQKARATADDLGLQAVCAAMQNGTVGAHEAVPLFERSFRRGLLDAILGRDETLRGFFGHEHQGRIQRFREIDGRIRRLTRELVRARLAGRLPREHDSEESPAAELGLLRKEIGKKTRHLPVRQLLSRIPNLLPRLKPCVLMSPLSVAQYLEAGREHFDLVVFDEASQIPVWDAIGAIARGRQLIVVGDPKQLPPTSFFQRAEENAEDEPLAEWEDLESILDELLSTGLRHKRLQWHYRSRHEGLIAFSNRHYYENDLLTFPSPDVGYSGVRFQLVDARYDKGKSRTNRGEAAALVNELVRRLRDPVLGRQSYGVVTFSLAQQQLVENLIDEQRRLHPDIEPHFGDEPPVEGEPVFVKNLENVQGDERDVVLFSICYGADEDGRISMNFGPLNREGGERRLNVAITRARREIVVFSTLRGDQIDLARTRARGVRDLKYFLEYAERGPRVLAAAPGGTPGQPAPAEFPALIAGRLRALGHQVHCDVGCSDYRIDVAVVDPAAPDRYLIGIECDGATYRQAATARDRDLLRQSVLEGLDWKLHRIWATDWWHDPEGEMAKLQAAVEGARTARQGGG